jgi:acetamidase/formamidase
MGKYHFYFDREAAPVIHIQSGDCVLFETEDADVSQFLEETDIFPNFEELYKAAGGTNPVTGPVYVDGAKPGDTLAVEIMSIEPGYWRKAGYTAMFAGLGALQNNLASLQKPLESRTKICEIKDGFVHFKSKDKKREIIIPAAPFVGTIGVAPKEDRCSAGKMGQDFCGNVDIPNIAIGSTVLLPVNVDGALLSLGDVHACQGDGEITGCALECQARVKVKVTVIPQRESMLDEWPLLLEDDFIGVIIPLGYANLSLAMQMGYTGLIRIMQKHYRFDELDAYQLLNLVGEVRVGSEYSCLCRINKKYLI